LIIARGLIKSFGDLPVLCGVDLHIEKGRIYGLAGKSGAGKSTLLRCINGLESYNGGTLVVGGTDVKSLSPKDARAFRKNIGMIFQQFSLLERLTVYENIALPLRCWKYGSKYIDKKVKELLEIVGMPEKIHQKPRELSGGQKQRVAIARALTMDAQILLCDEATSALDPKTAKAVIALLNRINKQLGITIIIVTHQMSVLRSACEEVAILEKGKVAACGMVEEIFLQQPRALKNLVGENGVVLTGEGINISILLSHDNSMKPVITRMARELEIDFTILGGEMEAYRDKILGSVVINVAEQNYGKVEQYLADHDVKWEIVKQESP
jgi:D-methionine transport system ATP-binding protein